MKIAEGKLVAVFPARNSFPNVIYAIFQIFTWFFFHIVSVTCAMQQTYETSINFS